MACADAPALPNGELTNGSANGILPGTTFPQKIQEPQNPPDPDSAPLSFDGPHVNGRPTTVTIFSPSQLAKSTLLNSLINVIIEAFRGGHEQDKVVYVNRDRFQYDGQFLDELSNAPGTFTYVVHYSGTNDVVATASAKRYIGEVSIVEQQNAHNSDNFKTNTWKRIWYVPDDTEAWELSTMAVDPKLQRQGLAGYLMRMTEDEVKRRSVASSSDAMSKQLVLYITTIKEINGPFYSRRGFKKDYEVCYEKGHLGGDSGFHIAHMSRVAEMGELQS